MNKVIMKELTEEELRAIAKGEQAEQAIIVQEHADEAEEAARIVSEEEIDAEIILQEEFDEADEAQRIATEQAAEASYDPEE